MEQDFKKKYNLSDETWSQVIKYISIYWKQSCNTHYEINKYITKNDIWDEFKEIRSINNHGSNKVFEGITPKYFKLYVNY